MSAGDWSFSELYGHQDGNRVKGYPFHTLITWLIIIRRICNWNRHLSFSQFSGRFLASGTEFHLSSQLGASITISHKHKLESLFPCTLCCKSLPCPVHFLSPSTCPNHTLYIYFRHYPRIWGILVGSSSIGCWESKIHLLRIEHFCWRICNKTPQLLSIFLLSQG